MCDSHNVILYRLGYVGHVSKINIVINALCLIATKYFIKLILFYHNYSQPYIHIQRD